MAKNWKLIHIKSKQHGENEMSPKLPTSEQLEYGEIAINYGNGIETIAIRNENDEIITIIPEYKIKEYVDACIKDALHKIKEETTFKPDDTAIDSGEY
jgi:hypothetical protein